MDTRVYEPSDKTQEYGYHVHKYCWGTSYSQQKLPVLILFAPKCLKLGSGGKVDAYFQKQILINYLLAQRVILRQWKPDISPTNQQWIK